MMTYRTKLLATVLGTFFWANASQAAIIPCSSGTIDQGCSFIETDTTGNFFDKIITNTLTFFTDTYKVTISQTGDVIVTMTRTPAGFTFTTLTFDGDPFTIGVTGTTFTRGPGTYDLVVAGSTSRTGSFTGTIDYVVAVPEPASWALMIGGFAMGGVMLRRQRRMQLLLA